MGHIQNPSESQNWVDYSLGFTTLPGITNLFRSPILGTQLQVVLYDCDDFTRKFYLDYLGLSDIAVLGQVMSVLSVFLIFYALQMA